MNRLTNRWAAKARDFYRGGGFSRHRSRPTRFKNTTITSVLLSAAALCSLLVWLGLAARADPSPSTAPVGTGQPPERTTAIPQIQPTAALGRVPPMPREFMMLLTHSMFVRGHIAEAGHIINPNARHVNNDSNNANQIRAESTLVFNGVTKTNNKIDALIEDVNSGRVMTVHPGDSIARGTVGKITMDSLEYISDGKTTQIGIGQNFTGSQGDVSSSPATTAPAPSGMSPEDILERLRQKRLQELGGK